MKVTPTRLPEVLIVEPMVFGDERGFFMESYNQRAFGDLIGKSVLFVQDNHSRSSRGVLRGLHYQLPPRAQGKLVRVVTGKIFDVAVDMRRRSPQFGHWVGTELSGDTFSSVWIPAGFAHGFLVLSEIADVIYKATDYYSPDTQESLRWDDPQIAIKWPDVGGAPKVSDKDAAAKNLEMVATF